MFDSERIAAEAWHASRIDELREDNRYASPAANVNQTADVWNDLAAFGNLQSRPRIEKPSLHIDHQQCGLPRLAAVEFVDTRLIGEKDFVRGWHS
jgi:hypothetical protein